MPDIMSDRNEDARLIPHEILLMFPIKELLSPVSSSLNTVYSVDPAAVLLAARCLSAFQISV